MNNLTYEIVGECTDPDRMVTLNIDSRTIYQNYVYSLVTSVDDILQFNLNFGLSEFEYVYNIKSLEGYLLLLPANEQYRYLKHIIFSKANFIKLWDEIGYDFEEDRKYITDVSRSDVFLYWFLSSGIYFEKIELASMIKEIQKQTLAYSEDQYEYVFEQLISLKEHIEFKEVVQIKSSDVEVSVYLDQKENYDWKAFFIDENGVVYIKISSDLGFKTTLFVS